MKVMIIGGQSSVARALISSLRDDVAVVTAGREGCDVRLDLDSRIDQADLFAGINVVVNTAASFGGKQIEDVEQAIRVNVSGAAQLCRLCTRAGVRQFVNISSIFATLLPSSPFYNAYALTKRHGDETLELCAALEGLSICILRPPRLYGIGAAGRKHQPFLSSIIDKATRHEEIVFYGRNDARRNFLHLQDMAAIITRVIDDGVTGTHACIHPDDIRCSQIATAAIEALRSRSSIRFDSEKPDIADDDVSCNGLLYEAIGYRPMISFAKGMQMEAAHQSVK